MEKFKRENGLMYLYDGDSEKVLVYRLIPDKNKFYKYKKAHMEEIPQDRQLWEASTYMSQPVLENDFMSRDRYMSQFESRKNIINSSNLNFSETFSGYRREHRHNFRPWNSKTEKYIKENGLTDKSLLLESYCREVGPTNYVEVIDDANLGVQALVLGDYNYERDLNNYARKTDIINIPESLLRLEQFVYGHFNELDESQIEEILRLYETIDINNPVYTQDFRDMVKMAKYFPITVVLKSSTEQEIENDKKVLSLLKKQK